MSAYVDGTKLKLTIGRLEDRYKANVKNVLSAAALTLKNDMIESIQKGQKTGRIYKRGSVTHRASAPGEAPASDTGTLASRSIDIRKKRDGLTVYVGVNKGGGLNYAKGLELGTKDIAPRPFVRPALVNRKDAIQRELTKAIKKSAQEAKRP